MSECMKVVSDSLRSHGLYNPWNSPGQNTGVGSRSLLQEIFPTQGSNPGLLYCRWILYQLSHQGSCFLTKTKEFFFFFFFLKKSDIWKCFSKLYWKEMRKHHIQLNEETIFVCDLSHWWHVHTPHWFSIDPSSTGQHASSSTRHHWFCVM